ncbi:sigma54 specific transcriptional regulator, Fis family [Desulfovibrio sp. X2]|uniref:sigma-54 interaction domain-containing protein n=1 Tax=Desulfovibrio sp. X2 TaxID=941449 RepID=UPI0003589794|nr:sigma-54 dependent transcriptional regulator [Desulfovibrio sp. X2]EPR37456.1 sigma54 specific transcriptional regulator, Fis family [Desulfovibrio sp. X2]
MTTLMRDHKDRSGKNLPLDLDDDALSDLLPGGTSFLFRSVNMRALRRVAAQVAASDAPVLIVGESGTGKELFARLIHTLSGRRNKPYVPVNCGVLKGELFADKFFGHEPGAFTGANRLQKGSFELAEDGTLFLDEVGEIPPQNQVDFLRVLEEKRFKRLGGEKDIAFRARIVAATNRRLQDMVRDGTFRADLFYRLNVIPISVPPLRERREEIAPLAEHFMEVFGHRYHKKDLILSEDTKKVLYNYSWPGNVRELKNLIERIVLMAESGVVRPTDLPLEMDMEVAASALADGPASLSLDAAVKEAEIRAIRRAFKAAGGNKTETARLLQISPRTLRHKVSAYGLRL